MLRVHGDPISILGKVLDQNRGSYTEINDFIRIGMELVSYLGLSNALSEY